MNEPVYVSRLLNRDWMGIWLSRRDMFARSCLVERILDGIVNWTCLKWCAPFGRGGLGTLGRDGDLRDRLQSPAFCLVVPFGVVCLS